jgi:hypothetical protein
MENYLTECGIFLETIALFEQLYEAINRLAEEFQLSKSEFSSTLFGKVGITLIKTNPSIFKNYGCRDIESIHATSVITTVIVNIERISDVSHNRKFDCTT